MGWCCVRGVENTLGKLIKYTLQCVGMHIISMNGLQLEKNAVRCEQLKSKYNHYEVIQGVVAVMPPCYN